MTAMAHFGLYPKDYDIFSTRIIAQLIPDCKKFMGEENGFCPAEKHAIWGSHKTQLLHSTPHIRFIQTIGLGEKTSGSSRDVTKLQI